MDFDNSCLRRPLNNVLMNPPMNLNSINSWGILTNWAIIWYLGKYYILDMFSFMISSLLFCSDVPFFLQIHTEFQVVPATVRFCPPQFEIVKFCLQCHFSTHIRTFLISLNSTFGFCDFYSKMSVANAIVICIAAMLLLCCCK